LRRISSHRILFCLLLVAAPAVAQHEQHSGGVGWVPREILERPVPLRQGIGRYHDPVTTTSRDAQAFYDQGMAYVHSFVWIEAARSFHQALRLDPRMAMAHVGLSYAYSGLEDGRASIAAFREAQALAANLSERERLRLKIRARHLAAMSDPQNSAKLAEFRRAIDAALSRYPADAALWILRGQAEEASPFTRGQAGTAASIPFYEAALARSPDNFAAHHYLIHCYEDIGRIPEALEQGEAYVHLAPAIPHAHHMYAHDLRRVGRTEEAVAEFRKADELENAYFRSEKIPAELDWHHVHNLTLLATSYQYLGQMKIAEQVLREAFAIPVFSDYTAFNRKDLPEFLLWSGRADEALAASREVGKSQWALARIVGHAQAGRALLALDRTAEAQAELTAAEKELPQVAPNSGVDPYIWILRGALDLKAGRWAEGAALLKKIEKRLRTSAGPDAWSQTLYLLESIARIARDAGDWELAQFTAQQMLEYDPAYAGSHYAMALYAEHRGDAATARREFAEAEKLWSKADPDLPQLARAKEKLSSAR
jgi:tetratricopeptide (TPR) repeat protein